MDQHEQQDQHEQHDRPGQDFEDHRRYLFAVAYRMLGSAAEAEDAVQETWLRRRRAQESGALAQVRNERAWLTTVTARICLDALGSARARRESYVGPWLPEPLVEELAAGHADPAGPVDPADRVTLDESVSLALLVVLETLTPAERTAFVLHEVFGVPFDEIGAVVGRTPQAVRQLASRARRHVQDGVPRFDVDPRRQREVAGAFFAAAAGGDLERLVAVLDPEVVLTADGGGVVNAARRPVLGADNVARFLIGSGRKAAGPVDVRFVTVNGGPGAVVRVEGGPTMVMALTVGSGRVIRIDLVLNPAKLRGLG